MINFFKLVPNGSPSSEKMEWNRESTLALIWEYRERPQLWNSNLPAYTNRQVREEALQEIATIFNTDTENVRKKINNLRTQYLENHKKVMEAKAEGADDESNQPKWTYYKDLLFLKDCTRPYREKNNSKLKLMEREEDIDEEESTDEDPDSRRNSKPQSLTPPPTKKRKYSEHELIAAAIGVVSKKDVLDHFGAYVASELRSMTLKNQNEAKKRIFNALMDFK